MGLADRLLFHQRKKFEKYFYTFEERAKIVKSIKKIWGFYPIDLEKSKKINKGLIGLFKLDRYLPDYQIEFLRKDNFGTINLLKDVNRESGEPYPIHSLDIQYILRAVNAPFEALAAGMDHDNAEYLIETKKDMLKKWNEADHKSLDDILDKIISEQLNRLNSHASEKIKPRELAYSVVIAQKVTRFESDENYYQSIDRIFSREISKDTIGLNGLFSEYKAKYGELVFDEQEKTMITELAACVKLADRIANTLDTYKKQTFSDKMKIAYKNLYVINRVTEYINEIKQRSPEHTSNENYKMMLELRNVLVEINEKRLLEEHGDLLQSSKNDKNFKEHSLLLDEYRQEYINSGGFRSLDYGFDENIYSGTLRRIWNRILKKDELIKSKLETDSLEQYVAITGLLEINTLFRDENDFSLEGFGKLGVEKKLGYYDDMGEKYSKEWYEKKEFRELHKIKNTESFYNQSRMSF